jgi:hypothetical protein
MSHPLSRLQAEWQRLFAASPMANVDELIRADGQVRAWVLALGQPADWSLVAKVWQGVQVDLGWPAPAIAVSGAGAYQLWFSLAQAVPAAEAHAVLDVLCARYLPEVNRSRLVLWPAVDPTLPSGWRHADPVPACMPHSECWSAFVAPDLAPVFADTPWLDIPPSLDGQAELLARHQSIAPGDLQRALVGMAPAASVVKREMTPAEGTTAQTDPRQFLLDAMNNPALDWALRIEAAKALLP